MENIINKKYFSIKTKITIGIVLFALLFMGLISYLSYLNFKKVSREDLNIHLSTMVGIGALQVDVEKHKLLITHSDEETETYKELKKDLQDIRGVSTDIRYIYSMRQNENNEIVFIVDAEENPADVAHLGDIYISASSFLKSNFSNIDKPVVEKDFYTDEWGTWLSGYAPFYDKDGNKDGILAIDIKASDILNKEREAANLYILTFLLSGLLASLIGINIGRRISKSISSLANMLKDERNLEIFPSSNDEIGELKNAFETILEKTNESKINIEEHLLEETKTIEKMNKILANKDVEIAQLKKELSETKKTI